MIRSRFWMERTTPFGRLRAPHRGTTSVVAVPVPASRTIRATVGTAAIGAGVESPVLVLLA